jgi:hypothetical protein
LYSFSSSVSSFFCFSVSSLPLALFLSSLTVSLLLMMVSMMLSPSARPVEGHIHRLKLIKRQMYGRAKLDLLRIRVLHAA